MAESLHFRINVPYNSKDVTSIFRLFESEALPVANGYDIFFAKISRLPDGTEITFGEFLRARYLFCKASKRFFIQDDGHEKRLPMRHVAYDDFKKDVGDLKISLPVASGTPREQFSLKNRANHLDTNRITIPNLSNSQQTLIDAQLKRSTELLDDTWRFFESQVNVPEGENFNRDRACYYKRKAKYQKAFVPQKFKVVDLWLMSAYFLQVEDVTNFQVGKSVFEHQPLNRKPDGSVDPHGVQWNIDKGTNTLIVFQGFPSQRLDLKRFKEIWRDPEVVRLVRWFIQVMRDVLCGSNPIFFQYFGGWWTSTCETPYEKLVKVIWLIGRTGIGKFLFVVELALVI